MHFYGTVWRPPYEAWSALLQITAGCTHHKCKFCTLYEDLDFKFRFSPIEEIEEDLKEIAQYSPGTLRLFLTGANPFVLNTEKLKNIAYLAKQYLPKLSSIGCFARITDICSKSVKDLKDLRAVGYNRITIGMETGDDRALKFMNKGYNSSDILEQCKKLEEANIEYILFYLVGISGKGNEISGVTKTAEILNRLNPLMIGANTLTVFESSLLYREIKQGNWEEESEAEKLNEMKLLISSLNIRTHFAALGASNILQLHGNLPKDKHELITNIDAVLERYSEAELRKYRIE